MSKNLNYIIIAIALFGGMNAFGQGSPGAIKGKVFNDLVELEPFAEVWVHDIGNKIIKTETDKDGRFTLKPLSPGSYVVYATGFGYDTTIINKVNVRADNVTYLNDIDIASGLRVNLDYQPGIIERCGCVVIEREMIELLPTVRDFAALLQGADSGIKKGDNGELYFRGARNGASTFYLDGIKLRDQKLNIPAKAYASIQIFTGGIPAKYGDTTGGVVAVETQSYFSMWRQEKARRDIALRKANRN
jgi:hypothetical protein